MTTDKCTCSFCTNYDKYKWAVIMECPCHCHISEGIVGHDSLCCEFPNGKRKDNPYKELKTASYYMEILNEFEKETQLY